MDNKIKLAKLWVSYCYLWGDLHCVLMSTYFGCVCIFSMQTVTLLRDVCFMRINIELCHNLIMSIHVTYHISYDCITVRFWIYGFFIVRLLTCLLWYKIETVRWWTSWFWKVIIWFSGFINDAGTSYSWSIFDRNLNF